MKIICRICFINIYHNYNNYYYIKWEETGNSQFVLGPVFDDFIHIRHCRKTYSTLEMLNWFLILLFSRCFIQMNMKLKF